VTSVYDKPPLLVVIESPFGTRPDGTRCLPEERSRNRRYLDACMLNSFERGEAPLASHRMYPGVLNDEEPEQRQKGLVAGWYWGAKADVVAVYVDLGVTPGMLGGIEQANLRGQPIEYRRLPPEKWSG
jgi:hypothetical protein